MDFPLYPSRYVQHAISTDRMQVSHCSIRSCQLELTAITVLVWLNSTCRHQLSPRSQHPASVTKTKSIFPACFAFSFQTDSTVTVHAYLSYIS